jgi:hypothetical protein
LHILDGVFDDFGWISREGWLEKEKRNLKGGKMLSTEEDLKIEKDINDWVAYLSEMMAKPNETLKTFDEMFGYNLSFSSYTAQFSSGCNMTKEEVKQLKITVK